MPDVMTSEQRSRCMSRIRGRDTIPEMLVRSLTHRLGYRFRLHCRTLPGCPDLVFPGRRKVIFVHGCFWHRHEGCRFATMPATRKEFWSNKLIGNRDRDQRNQTALRKNGWRVLVVWECYTGDNVMLAEQLRRFLGPRGKPPKKERSKK
jgi:DNA mismatch endonuclease, patch repair protein